MEGNEIIKKESEGIKNNFARRAIAFVYAVLLLFCFFFALCSRITVKENKEYHTKNEVALYIFKYKKLPSNYKTKNELSKIYKKEERPALKALQDGYAYGGMKYSYEQRDGYKDSIINYTKNEDLRECDIYSNIDCLINNSKENEERGVERLVYASNGTEVFYSPNHYGKKEIPGFFKLTLFKINAVSNTFWILFFVLLAGGITISIIILYNKDEKSKDTLIFGVKSLAVIFFSPLIVIYVIVSLFVEHYRDKKRGSTKSNNEISETDDKDNTQ